MKLSTESRYAILALVVLAGKPADTVVEAGTVAEEAGVPAPFLSKTFAKLTRHGILSSHRGRVRGYSLARSSADISLREVLEAIDGPDLFQRCVFWTDTCDDEAPCPLHPAWKDLRPKITEAMGGTSLADVAAGRAKLSA